MVFSKGGYPDTLISGLGHSGPDGVLRFWKVANFSVRIPPKPDNCFDGILYPGILAVWPGSPTFRFSDFWQNSGFPNPKFFRGTFSLPKGGVLVMQSYK